MKHTLEYLAHHPRVRKRFIKEEKAKLRWWHSLRFWCPAGEHEYRVNTTDKSIASMSGNQLHRNCLNHA